METRFIFDFENEDYDSFLKFVKKAGLKLNAPVIHIAGSNGKSSTANFLSSIYEKAGYRVGLFLNTFFASPEEMIKINHEDIPSSRFEEIEKGFAKLFEKYDCSDFQKAFAIALSYFSSNKLDLVIVETGLGGTFDATNIGYENKVLSIITNISLEHTELLGTTLSQIANEKSGIFAEQVPVLLGHTDDSCKPTLVENALELSCSIFNVDVPHNVRLANVVHFDYGNYLDLSLCSGALYQVQNACVAIEAVIILQKEFPVEEDHIREGLKVRNLPGHFDIINGILFDGAENPYAMQGLASTISSFAPSDKAHAIFASLRGQNIAVELPLIDNYVGSITITTFSDPRARKEEDYFLYAPDYETAESFLDAAKKLKELHPEELIIVTGSMEFVYDCMKQWRKA